ncbi:hypothetical protein VMZ64_00160 [Streptomyces noursei]|nr:hypothetical protein [Streptomyces noursei]
MAVQSPSFPVPNAFELLCAQYAGRLPARLEDLAGPAHGTVDLPLHVVWSGRCSYGLEQPRSRMSLYRTVLAEGQRQDLIDFLNRDLLLAQWPVLRTLISRPIRDVWEAAFPELTLVRAASPARCRAGSSPPTSPRARSTRSTSSRKRSGPRPRLPSTVRCSRWTT